ncbi:MAG: ankyrin repeat domain-containing protein [Candidatus Thiothrix putei]|uniref:Ankyrin repeat domain-containing protein n=1 Tax=Candidatus Thiothrix putei TaxID=3080811 RepID=A0AA95HBS4_9GAMM|nr:MAG: ankyrin repeat domain-containing protein [Candidatus Thiothrix putei]
MPTIQRTFATLLVAASLLTACTSTPTQPDTKPASKTIITSTAKPTTCAILNGYTAQDELMLEPPVYYAVISKDLASAECLLKMGKDPNKPDGIGTTPLLAAIDQGNTNMVSLLLKHGADANHLKDWQRPLDVARKKGNPTIIKLLEQAGATSENDRTQRAYNEAATFERASNQALFDAEQEYQREQQLRGQ